ncbi:MAG TPA: hypothetical protein PKY88_00805 [Anaerohalosphaeraceae bacterium]|nr:hypothetical protein [Anaerohalosphaeraceae bacterium]
MGLTAKNNQQVCCKIKRVEQYPAVVLPDGLVIPGFRSTCTQETIPNPQGNPAGRVCRCHYRNQKNVSVYDWHTGECCWCTIYLESIFHTRVRIVCENDSFIIHVYPDTFGAWDKRAVIHVEKPSDDVYNNLYLSLASSKISCAQAMSLKSLDGASWYFSSLRIPGIPGNGNCFEFASSLFFQTINSCP